MLSKIIICFILGFCTLFLIFVGAAYLPEEQLTPVLKERSNSAIWELERGFNIAYAKYSSEHTTQYPPVIYLHGGPGGYIHSSIVETLKPLTSEGVDVYFYDQLGSGLSERPAKFRDVSLPLHVQDLHEIVTQHIAVEKVTLIGHSFGANLATHFLAAYPELVSKIVYSSPGQLDPILYSPEGVPVRNAIEIPAEMEFIEPWSYHEESDSTLFRPKSLWAMFGALVFDSKFVSDIEMDRVFNNLASKFTKGMVCDPNAVQPEEGGAGMYAYMSANYNPDLKDVRPLLYGIDIPSIILQGQCDSGEYGTVIEYVELLGSEYYFIEGAGHIIWWEKPEEYYRLISDFLLL